MSGTTLCVGGRREGYERSNYRSNPPNRYFKT